MASKSAQQEPEKAEVIEEALDTLDKTLDRVKVLYEQYFLGIQKQPPQFLHTDVERKLRDLAQLQIRNTALRYRFVTIQQKYGSYHTYWRRTLREIEAGRYHRSLLRITRQAAATGAEIPQEILASMPRRMREQVRRDREAALALQRHRMAASGEPEPAALAPLDAEEDVGFIRESPDVHQHALRARAAAYVLDEADADLDPAELVEADADVDADADADPDPVPARPSMAGSAPAPPRIPPPPAAATGAPPRPPPLPRLPPLPAVPPKPPPVPAVAPAGALKPPPGMTDADVKTLYARYVQAKERIGQAPGPGAFAQLLSTIHAQAPKIMDQYQAKGVDFSVVIKDNQVIIRAKPKL